jgi:hypothetical protein
MIEPLKEPLLASVSNNQCYRQPEKNTIRTIFFLPPKLPKELLTY